MKKLLKFGDSFIDIEKILCVHNQRIWFTADTTPLDVSEAKYAELIEVLNAHQIPKDTPPRRKQR